MSPQITNNKMKFTAPAAGFFPDEEMPEYIEKLQSKQVKIERKQRTDLQYGNVVVILEGQFAAKRAIYLGNEGFNAIVVGPSNLNGVPLMKIDERFLLKTSTILKIQKVKIEEEIFVSEKSFDVEIKPKEASDLEKSIEAEIMKEVQKEKFMKTYLSSEFDFQGIENLEEMNF